MIWFLKVLASPRAWKRLAGFACFLLFATGPASAQPFQIIEPVESLDREVVLRWTLAPGDTFTAAERQTVVDLGFSVDKAQGWSPTKFRSGSQIVGQGPVRGDNTGVFLDIGTIDDLYLASTPPPPVPPDPVFAVSGVFQFGRNLIGVAFSQPVDPTTALAAGNYSFSPPVNVTALRLQDNGQTAILEAGSDLTPGGSFTLTVGGVTNTDGVALVSGGPFPFDAPNVTGAVNIDQIYANTAGYSGQTVTVFGQVTLATGARADLPPDGFIQDGTGRGIQLFGGAVQPAVDSRNNAVVVTGVVELAPRVRITGYTASTLASDLPLLGPRVLPLKDVSAPNYEGSYVQTRGFLSRVDAVSSEQLIRYFAVSRDTLFTGYQIWRAPDEDPTRYALLRTYSLLDSTWTFVGDTRIFVDPDSIIARGTERDPELEPDETVPGPFNGFGYRYAITWFNAVVDATVFPFRVTLFDTLRGEEGVVSGTVYPTPSARVSTPLLAQVRVVPNPYNPRATFGQQAFPGAPRVQFVNLPAEALVKIYTASGDLVREITKVVDPGDDSVVWDLKNADGRDVSSGVYIYYVTSGVEEVRGHFVIAR